MLTYADAIQQVDVEELRQTQRDRSTDIIHLSERIAELESDRYSVSFALLVQAYKH
jgi:hypothetical protein